LQKGRTEAAQRGELSALVERTEFGAGTRGAVFDEIPRDDAAEIDVRQRLKGRGGTQSEVVVYLLLLRLPPVLGVVDYRPNYPTPNWVE
jgi:hypothetical protein